MRWFSDKFASNPIAWLLLVAFCIAEWGNWAHGKELSEICSLMDRDSPLYTRVVYQTDRVDAICNSREADQ